MYILVTRVCIIPSVLKDIICTKTISGKREFLGILSFKFRQYLTAAQTGCTSHFLHNRHDVWRVVVLFVSGCSWLLY